MYFCTSSSVRFTMKDTSFFLVEYFLACRGGGDNTSNNIESLCNMYKFCTIGIPISHLYEHTVSLKRQTEISVIRRNTPLSLPFLLHTIQCHINQVRRCYWQASNITMDSAQLFISPFPFPGRIAV